MASTGRTTKTKRRRRRNQQLNKKQSPQQNKQKEVISTDIDIGVSDVSCFSKDSVVEVSDSVCSTPKGRKFRIPEISTCPPAPKKQRVLINCSLRKSLSFFAPPDLDVFFCLALQDVSVPLVC